MTCSVRVGVMCCLIGAVGCSENAKVSNPTSSSPGPSPASQPPPLSVMPRADRVLNQSEVEIFLREMSHFTDVSLTSTGNGSYTGTAKDAEGRVNQLTVRQVPGGLDCRHSYPGQGGESFLSFGKPIDVQATTPATAAGPATSAGPSTPGVPTKRWVYLAVNINGSPGKFEGHFENTTGNQWREKARDGEHPFVEKSRTAGYVELFDAGRNITLRLFNDRCEISNGGPFIKIYEGKWSK